MFRLLTNNFKTQARNFKSIYSNSNKTQVSKTTASVTKLNERLSFLKSEDEMRKYFNIIDWEKKDCEDTVLKKFKEEKDKFSQERRNYQTFTREELFNIAKKFQIKLGTSSNKDDYSVPEEILNYKKESLKDIQLVNEFSMDNVEFLKNKPKNYILISGFENTEDIPLLLDLLKSQGEIVKHNVLPDLMGRASCLEVYYYTDAEAKTAKANLHNYSFKHGHFLRVWNYNDSHRETLEDKTVVVTGLENNLKQNDILILFSKFGHIVKLEMPIYNSNNSKVKDAKHVDVINTCDVYFNELEKNINNHSLNEQTKIKNKLLFYLIQIKKLIKEFKEKVSSNSEISKEQAENQNKNLLVEIKFFMKKFFPNEIINSLILPELNKTNNTENVNKINEKYDQISQDAFKNILNNLENFLSKYEEKMERLSRPLTKDEIPIDLLELENNNKKGSTSSDPEKLDKNLIFQAVDESNITEIKNEITKINFYSTFLPIEEQIAKLNFIRSLTEEEKTILKDKFDLNLSVNAPKFLDYFINFSKAIGLQVIDKYIELSELYMSMTPIEKAYHGKKLARKIKMNGGNEPRGSMEKEARDSILRFLEIRQLRTIKDVYHLNAIRRRFDESPYTRYLNTEEDVLLTDLFNMARGKKLANISLSEFIYIINRNRVFNQKISYIQALVPMNIAKKRLYIEKIRARMVKYNEVLLEFIKNYKILPNDHELRQKYDPEVNKLAELIFGKFDSLNDVDMKLLVDDAEQEKGGFDLPEKHLLNYGSAEDHKSKAKKGEKKEDKKFNRTEYKYSGNALNENQIINRLDYIKSNRDKLINSVLRISNLKHYGSKKYNKLNQIVKSKLNENVNEIFADNPKLQAHYLEKIEKKFNSMKYTGLDFNEKQYKLEEIVDDLIQKEIDYVRKAQYAKKYIENVEELIDDKVTKGNLVKALSVYDAMFQIHNKYQNYEYLKNKSKGYQGSPIKVFFREVKEIFDSEMAKIQSVKDQNLNTKKSMDEMFSRRKELIEDYTNKIVGYKNAFEANEIADDLEKYKLKKIHNYGSSMLLDEDDMHLQNVYFNELKKKEYEIKQNKIKYGVENEEEYADVTALISNLNKLEASKEKTQITTYQKIMEALNRKKSVNKGYAFVTFATSDEAKKLYLESLGGLTVGKHKLKVEPKFDSTHEHFDQEFMLKRAKADGNIIDKHEDLVKAENKLKEFEENFYKNLEENDKLNEFKSVKDAFRDLYSDPFKKHDRNNPMTAEELEEAKYRMKQSGQVDNTWLFDDDKLETLRINRDKRVTRKYTMGQLIKKGIASDEILDKCDNSSIVDSKYESIKSVTDSLFNKTNDFEPIQKTSSKSASNGRNLTPLGTSEFIEQYLGYDYLNSTTSFEKDSKEKAMYSEIKELRDRFPKEKFTKDPKETENLIDEVNSRFVRLLKYEDSEKTLENTSEEILDKVTNLTPVGKQIQTIINNRNDKVQDEETRQLITLQNFYEKRIEKHILKNTLIEEINENSADVTAINHILYNSNPYKDYYRTKSIDPPLQDQPRRVEDDKDAKKFQPGDTSFEAFLHRRREIRGEKKDEATDEKNKTQFDQNNLTAEMIRKVKEESTIEILNSIKTKYEQHISSFEKVTPSSKVDYKFSKDNIYEYLNNKMEVSKHLKSFEKEESKQLKIEKLKSKFIEELEKNFEEELETLPSFKEYFLKLKYGETKKNVDNNTSSIKDLLNYSEKFNFDKKREEMALLVKGNLSTETFEKTFVKNQKEREERLEKWINKKDQEDFFNQILIKKGFDPKDKEALEILKSTHPEIFDENLAKQTIENKKHLEATLEEINLIEEKSENEYYFNPDSNESLEEHLAYLSNLKNTKVSLRKDAEGRIIIRREFKNTYKYDLDDLMSFDINKEKEKMIKKIENFNFKAEMNSNIEYYLNFYQVAKSEIAAFKKLYNQEYSAEEFSVFIAKTIHKVEDYIRVSYSLDNFYFDDFKRLVENLLTLNPKSLTKFISSVSKLIKLVRSDLTSQEEISEVLKDISNFSKDIFNEREVRLFVELMKGVLNSLGDRNINELDNFSKFIFIQNVLLKDILSNLSMYLNNEEMVYVYGMLKLLPEKIPSAINLNEETEIKKKLRVILWNKYKNYILNEFTIVLKKEKEIKPNVALESALEQKFVLSSLANDELPNEKTVDKEIEEFSNKLKEFYYELTRANSSEYDLSSIITDEELFIEEISEQIQNRLKRLKTGKEITKQDLVRRKFNEENLYKKQLEYVHKVGNKYEAMLFREDVANNEEMLNEVKDALTKNAQRKKKLLDEGKPEIDFEYPRLI